ncbi:hypothetical protein QNO07_12470 [Streptomyces sp. 549]|uniref:hypothetical protein n=1 Tax=Streptomyces sp. 549 TaxID=3049076 RepID=UPI0024C421CE|nr:hypothetical protein [Streptomyces sp. 549]MDK1474222.1 hypothetical protein [Streptomyces sp. 549]
MSGDDRLPMPPVLLPAAAELARAALSSPLLTRSAQLARWAGEGIRVGAGGELLGEQLKSAAAELGLGADADGPALAAEAWSLAVDTGLVEIEEDADAEPSLESDEPVGTATPGEELGLLTAGSPGDVLEIWLGALETVLADAATPNLEDLLSGLEGAVAEDGSVDPDAFDPEDLEWDPEEEAAFLDGALGNLYLLTATDPAVLAGEPVPLPVLAASMVVPDGAEGVEPTDDVLEEVSAVMMRLDEQFRLLAPLGALEYRPVDEELIRGADEEDPDAADAAGEEDPERYGLVRLTALGVYGVRARMLDAGLTAPAVGDLADADAAELLGVLPAYPEPAAQAELEQWLDGRDRLQAARDLLDAARGEDPLAPRRRLLCQQALSLVDTAAEPALREVLDDGQLGGLARVWLAEHGITDVPPPGEELVFWLTVDTLAAQLGGPQEEAGAEELRELVQGLADQHSGFFDKVWRVPHPATAEVLDAVARLHPDRAAAKEARKAAYRARSRA